MTAMERYEADVRETLTLMGTMDVSKLRVALKGRGLGMKQVERIFVEELREMGLKIRNRRVSI